MAWNFTIGSCTTTAEEVKPCEDERVFGLLRSPNLLGSPTSQDLDHTSTNGRATLKRHNQSMVNLHVEVHDMVDDITVDDYSQLAQKKRRLTAEQVKFLEMTFEAEKVLEPERKALIAKHLGLLPRQVAIWFQNRRARWKNKQLEQEYEDLKSKYNNVMKENKSILKEKKAMVEEKERLQAEVDRLTSLLLESLDHGAVSAASNGVTTRLMKSLDHGSNELQQQVDDQQADDVSLCNGKSELKSPTKSENQSEVQEDSGQSYNNPTSTVLESQHPTTEHETTLADEEDASDMADLSANINIMCPLQLKLEDPSFVSPEEHLLGLNLFNPLIFQHLAAASAVCLEDACTLVFGLEDQFAWCE